VKEKGKVCSVAGIPSLSSVFVSKKQTARLAGEVYYCLVWFLLYAHRHRSILGAAGHVILTPANQLMEEYNSEPPEQSSLLRWTEEIASLCFGPRGDRTPYLLIHSQTLIDCATGPGYYCIARRVISDIVNSRWANVII
jgi:hypothetical protein